MNDMDTLQRIFRVFAEPFSSWESFAGAIKGMTWTVTSLESRTGWLYLISSAMVAYAVYWHGWRQGHLPRDKSFREIVFPADVYFHPSAVADYKFVLLDKVMRMVLYVPLFSAITYVLYKAMTRTLGPSPFQMSPSVAYWCMPLGLLVIMDFSFFVVHWLMHRVPLFWPFHEVHHSAEVLTPVTVYRIHPVEELITNSATTVITAAIAALFTSTTSVKVDPLSIFGVNAVTFGFFIFGFQLRHSHVWLSYGPVWSRLFISPAQHQVHHSVAEKHWNKNFGFMFACWDWVFGTLYIPHTREHIVFGCGTDPDEYATVSRLYFRPFVKSFSVLRSLFPRRLPHSAHTPVASSRPDAREPVGCAVDQHDAV